MSPNNIDQEKMTTPANSNNNTETVPLKGGTNGYGSTADSGSAPGSAPGSARQLSRKSSGKHSRTPSRSSHVLLKTQTSLYEDTRTFAEGSIPHSIAIGTIVGVICGVAAYLYYAVLFWVLKFVWTDLPQMVVVDKWPEWAYFLWIPLVGFTMAIGVGITVIYMGEPGDLPYTIKCVHEDAYVAMSHGEFCLSFWGYLRTY